MPILSRHDLVHATNKQLHSIGLSRDHNSGWLQKALAAEFSEPQVVAFKAADTRRPDRPDMPALPSAEDEITRQEYTGRFLAELIALVKNYDAKLPPAEILDTVLRFSVRFLRRNEDSF